MRMFVLLPSNSVYNSYCAYFSVVTLNWSFVALNILLFHVIAGGKTHS